MLNVDRLLNSLKVNSAVTTTTTTV